MSSSVGTWDTPPTFQVDLDLPPERRWEHIVQKYLPLLGNLERYISEVAHQEYGSILSSAVRCAGVALSHVHGDKELMAELKGIARLTEPLGLTYGKLLMLNCGYDLLARCTSAVIECPVGTGPTHLRNMDWDAEVFWPLTINVEFRSKERVVFKGTSWVGIIGLQTGMRPYGWSVSLNFRQVQPWHAVAANIWHAIRRAWPVSFLIRRTLQDVADFSSALDILRSQRLMAPCYLILAGTLPGQGAVLERSRHGVDRCQTLDPAWAAGCVRQELLAGACVISNLDCCHDSFDFSDGSRDMRWAEGDALLMTALERRRKAISLIESVTTSCKQASAPLSSSSCMHILGTPPVCNDQTVYSCVLRPCDAAYETRVVLNWEEYSKRVDECAWNDYARTDACRATKSKQLISNRGLRWPAFSPEVFSAERLTGHTPALATSTASSGGESGDSVSV